MTPSHSVSRSSRITRRQVLLLGLAALLCLAGAAQAAPYRPGAVVLAFVNASAYTGTMMERRAADQLALDLAATGLWRVVDRARTDETCRQRELRPPIAVGYMQAVAHTLGAEVIFSGVVQKVEVDPTRQVARVSVLVEACDQMSGQLLVRRSETGEAKATETEAVPTDVLVSRALARACGQVAQQACQGPLLAGEVTNPRDSQTTTIKIPEGAQVAVGERFLIYRAAREGNEVVPAKFIAIALVSGVKDGQCEARVQGRASELHTGDLAYRIAFPAK